MQVRASRSIASVEALGGLALTQQRPTARFAIRLPRLSFSSTYPTVSAGYVLENGGGPV